MGDEIRIDSGLHIGQVASDVGQFEHGLEVCSNDSNLARSLARLPGLIHEPGPHDEKRLTRRLGN